MVFAEDQVITFHGRIAIFAGKRKYLVMLFFECCCQSVDDALEAQKGGAKRIELCERLDVGGVTPRAELIKEVLGCVSIPVNVLVRPREGDFVYDEEEGEAIIDVIERCKALGVNGIVVGALNKDGDIDMPLMRRFIEAARPLEVTFHRAFDECREPKRALEDIITLGCNRLLTSGQAPSAPEGAALIKELIDQANGRIIIMPGAGIKPENISALVQATGASEYHGSAHGVSGFTEYLVVRDIVNG